MNHVICAPVFSDHMVLQQNKPIRIFGHARKGICITASLFPEKDAGTEATGSSFSPVATASATVSPENLPKDMTFAPYPDAPADHIRFCVTLPPVKAGGPYRLSVLSQTGQKEGDDTVACEVIEFHDVMIGEVWLAGGQSNMEYALEADRDFERVKNAPSSRVRFYNVGRRFFVDENFYEEEQKDHWMCAEENLGTWSAVGYYFAEKIAEETGVLVGIIGCNLGGTSASAWQNKESLLSCEKTRSYWEEYEEILSTLDPDIYEKERLDYIEYHSKWQPKSDEYYRTHPNATWEEMQAAVGTCKWPGPMGPKHEFRPCGLYESMLMRIMPFTLRGFLYYQGESDEHKPNSYYALLKNLIALWRKDFGDSMLPFLFVQLPVHKYRDNPPSESWCILREAQMQVHRDVAGTGIAVAMDLGEYNNIHPTSKILVGERLALQALYHVYHAIPENRAYGPLWKSKECMDGKLCITLSHAENGLVIKDFTDKDTSKLGFEISGNDGVFHPAFAEFSGNTVTLSSPEVCSPCNARYLWVEYAPVYLYGTNGLPLAPFHTGLSF